MSKPFSNELEEWLRSPSLKTFGELQRVFGEKSFAVVFLLLLFIPALPIPTGGISHITELIALLFSLEMLAGRRTLWIPKRLQSHTLGKVTEEKALPFIVRRVRWLEKYSRPRAGHLYELWPMRSFIALVISIFCFSAFVSIPFSGLDTLPSLGVVIIALGMVLSDIALLVVGLIVGSIGVGLIVGSGAALSAAFHHFF